MDRNIKNWYAKEFKSDKVGADCIKDNVSFRDLVKNFMVYTGDEAVMLIFEGYDSIVRERIFDELSKILDVEYDVVYNTWLWDKNAPLYFAYEQYNNKA